MVQINIHPLSFDNIALHANANNTSVDLTVDVINNIGAEVI